VYDGSGTYWKKHLLKYGNDIETIELWEFADIKNASEFALNYSKQNNIVESLEWANLIYEDAVGNPGGYSHTDEAKAKLSKANMQKVLTDQHKLNIKLNHAKPHFNTHFSDETKSKMSSAHRGKVLSEEHKRSISLARTGVKRAKYKKKIKA
jgi:hypothetical protein